MACEVLGNALFYAWSKNTAGNSNYGLRGAGKCVFYGWSKNTAYSSIYGLRGAGTVSYTHLTLPTKA